MSIVPRFSSRNGSRFIAAVWMALAISSVSAGAESAKAKSSPQAAGIDIIQNGGFEVGLMNWGWSSRGTAAGYPGDVRIVSIDPQPTREKAGDAPEGNHVLQLRAPAAAQWTIRHREYEVKKGSYRVIGCFYVDHAVTFSARGASKTITPAAKWQEIALDVTVLDSSQRLSLTVTGVGPGVARMDNFRIVALDPSTAVGLPVQVGLEVSAADHICGNLGDAPAWATEPGGSAFYGGHWPNNRLPNDWKDWEKYVRTVVSHYYPRIRHWAVWNEPNHPAFLHVPKSDDWPAQYLTLLKHTYPVAKAVRPEVRIFAGTVTNPAALAPIIQTGTLQYADGLAFHWSSWLPRWNGIPVPVQASLPMP
jgi:hypothetical protein